MNYISVKILSLSILMSFAWVVHADSIACSRKPGSQGTYDDFLHRIKAYCDLKQAETVKEKTLARECFQAYYSDGQFVDILKPKLTRASKLTSFSTDLFKGSCTPGIAINVDGVNRFGETASAAHVCLYEGQNFRLTKPTHSGLLGECNDQKGN